MFLLLGLFAIQLSHLCMSGNVAFTSVKPVLKISVKFLFDFPVDDDVIGDVTGELPANKARRRSSWDKQKPIIFFKKLNFFFTEKNFSEK